MHLSPAEHNLLLSRSVHRRTGWCEGYGGGAWFRYDVPLERLTQRVRRVSRNVYDRFGHSVLVNPGRRPYTCLNIAGTYIYTIYVYHF